jgi:hypothetical protein
LPSTCVFAPGRVEFQSAVCLCDAEAQLPIHPVRTFASLTIDKGDGFGLLIGHDLTPYPVAGINGEIVEGDEFPQCRNLRVVDLEQGAEVFMDDKADVEAPDSKAGMVSEARRGNAPRRLGQRPDSLSIEGSE